jgi:hypothetical protein
MFRFSLQICLKYILFQEELSEMWYKMCVDLHVNYPLFLSDSDETWIFLDVFLKNTQISNFAKTRLEGEELFHA